jgi:medium-chain acyl-[acyl-carrier-protein] hydrolase
VLSGLRSPLLPHRTALPYDLPTDVFLSRLRQLEGTPPEALDSPELMELILPILRADCQVCDLYRLINTTPLDCPLTVFGGVADVEADEPAMRAWAPLAGAGFAVQMFSGGHFFVQSQRDAVLRALDQALAPHHPAPG